MKLCIIAIFCLSVVQMCSAGCSSVNQATLNLIKNAEGFASLVGPDPIGLPTVGYGHLCQKPNCAELPSSGPLTQAQAQDLLVSDIKPKASCLGSAVNSSVKLNENQWGALISWTFNIGCSNMQSSTLIKRLNNKEDPNLVAEQELGKWNKANGKVFSALVARRANETQLFKTASTKEAHPSCN
ncbi:glycoside hydrolase family 24 protein [Kickxella alabastrina]|uniref:glycoside hydrolase family 24 protein n=1 Tax=Kickxella alabastrina TaxID=61397 RepID=UPI00221F60AD|nr:glycoside hydrolase family 24 protein [Kickxella alabastrina]XP_051389481.1 glycoside hydrolase family 24 protein [Kickxella alabastrina]KAI7822781.1 glycoside hydrolase family 24 protein [Kickxella alabastrina]KAI7822795.1 glycoside hydrolase family 24 protein [Kickxella alabastrina]